MKPIRSAFVLACALLATAHSPLCSQTTVVKWTTWTLLQAVPSPTLSLEGSGDNARVLSGLRWTVTPLNYAFNANRLVSPVQCFFVNPLRRHGGSVELFVQPMWALTAYHNTDLDRFSVGLGARAFIPAEEFGEYLSFSVGGKYLLRRTTAGEAANSAAAEVGVYTLFGIVGFQIDYTADPANRVGMSLALKYY